MKKGLSKLLICSQVMVEAVVVEKVNLGRTYKSERRGPKTQLWTASI